MPVMRSSWLLGQQLSDTMTIMLPRVGLGWMSEEDERWGGVNVALTSLRDVRCPCAMGMQENYTQKAWGANTSSSRVFRVLLTFGDDLF